MEYLTSVAAWMSEQGLGAGPVENVSEIVGGTQNIMLRFTRSGREYVFRRGPKHLRPVSNKVILRETKVLHALAGTDVPHPRLIAVCEDTSVLGDAVFYLMEPVDGFNAGSGLPALHAGDAGIRHEMGLSMADAVARLGAVDHLAVGLADFGKGGRVPGSPSAALAFRSWSPTAVSRPTRDPTSATWRRWRDGCSRTSPKRGRRGSCTATTTPRT